MNAVVLLFRQRFEYQISERHPRMELRRDGPFWLNLMSFCAFLIEIDYYLESFYLIIFYGRRR